MLSSEKILTIFFIALSGLLVNPLSVFGQCSANIVEQTDSTLLVQAELFQGIAFTKNRSLGIMEDINSNEIDVTIKNISELPSTAQIVSLTIEEVCSLENSFEDWWNIKTNRERLKLKEDSIKQFNRQYIAYNQSSKKYIQVTLFDSGIFDESEWKAKPITCDHCWPIIFVLNYDVEAQQLTLNTNFK